MSAVESFELILGLLAIVIGLQWVGDKLRLPPATALLVGGTALAFTPNLPTIVLDPELALVLFLPPLLMDGAFYTALGHFRRHIFGILSLAVGAVIFTTFVVGVVAHWLVPSLPLAACFALGAIVSPPDAVSARAVLQRVVLPRRLKALVEGESLLNDATGLVLFRFAVVATLSGTFSLGSALGNFAWLALGGAVVGAVIAVAAIFIIRKFTDDTLIVMSSLLISWTAYIAGEHFHVSGVIAVVTAGLIFGWYQHVIYNAAVRLRSNSVSHILMFILEALVFILIGFSLRGVLDRIGSSQEFLDSMALPIFGVVLAVIVSRFLWVFGNNWLVAGLHKMGLTQKTALGWRQSTILSWTGMRGVVTLAVALSLPADMPGRDFMLLAAFAVILVTVIGQGTSLGWLIRVVKPVDEDPPAPMGLLAAEHSIACAQYEAVCKVAYDDEGVLIHPQLHEYYLTRRDATGRFMSDEDKYMGNFKDHMDLMQAAQAAGRAELIRLHRAGQIEDEILHNLERDLDVTEMGIIFQRDT